MNFNANRNELTKITYSNGEPDHTYTYDTFGRNTSAANQHATVSYGYDAAGRRASEQGVCLAGLFWIGGCSFDDPQGFASVVSVVIEGVIE